MVLLSWCQLSCTKLAKNGTCPCMSYFGVVRVSCCGVFYFFVVGLLRFGLYIFIAGHCPRPLLESRTEYYLDICKKCTLFCIEILISHAVLVSCVDF